LQHFDLEQSRRNLTQEQMQDIADAEAPYGETAAPVPSFADEVNPVYKNKVDGYTVYYHLLMLSPVRTPNP
jgi:hypothetical protein